MLLNDTQWSDFSMFETIKKSLPVVFHFIDLVPWIMLINVELDFPPCNYELLIYASL